MSKHNLIVGPARKWHEDFPRIVSAITEDFMELGWAVNSVRVSSAIQRVTFVITDEEGTRATIHIDPDEKCVSV